MEADGEQRRVGTGHVVTLRWESVTSTRSREEASVSAGWRVKGWGGSGEARKAGRGQISLGLTDHVTGTGSYGSVLSRGVACSSLHF